MLHLMLGLPLGWGLAAMLAGILVSQEFGTPARCGEGKPCRLVGRLPAESTLSTGTWRYQEMSTPRHRTVCSFWLRTVSSLPPRQKKENVSAQQKKKSKKKRQLTRKHPPRSPRWVHFDLQDPFRVTLLEEHDR